MATIYARDIKRLYPNSGGGYVTRCKLFTTTAPDTLPTTGSGIFGMEALDTFAAGSELVAITAKKIWLVGSDGESFEVQKVWSEVDLNPEAKTSDMTQEVGKDANGKLWTAASKEYGDYELIETITTTEQLTEIVRTTEPDGTAYRFKRMLLRINAPASGVSSTYGWVYMYLANVQYGSSSVNQIADNVFKQSASQRSTWYLISGLENSSYIRVVREGQDNDVNSSYNFAIAEYINRIKITVYGSAIIPAGTVIDIYGVRA